MEYDYRVKRIIVALLLSLAPSLVSPTTLYPFNNPEFDARCFGRDEGYQFTNPKNCAEFFHCTHGRSILKKCPESTYFDERMQRCDYPENVNCNGINAVPDCEKARHGDIFPNPNDCTTFYVCNYQKPVLVQCDRFLNFDRLVNNCNWADLVKCPKAASFPF